MRLPALRPLPWLIALAVSLTACNHAVTPAEAGSQARIVGILGAQAGDLSDISALGPLTVQIPLPADRASFDAALADAGRLGLNLIVSIDDRSRIQTPGLGMDVSKLTALLSPIIAGSAADPHFAGVMIVDDPCHVDRRGPKWQLTSAQLVQAYSAVKAINSHIGVVVNFSKSTCLTTFVQGAPAGTHIADVAIMKVFYYKWSTTPGLMENYATTARNARAFDASMRIIPKLGVYETVGREASTMPTAQWLREREDEFAKSGAFDGLFLYNYRPSEPIEVKTMSGVMADPAWAKTLKGLFATAAK